MAGKHRPCHALLCLALLAASWGMPESTRAQVPKKAIPVHVQRTLAALIADEDTDNDRSITINDPRLHGTERGNKSFTFRTATGEQWEVAGTYYLSNLLQELKLLEESGDSIGLLDAGRVFEEPVERIANNIRRHFWRGLTRRIDKTGLRQIISDEKMKTADGDFYLYVPHADTSAFHYFTTVQSGEPGLNLRVIRLPAGITPEFVKGLEGRHGILSLALVRGSDGGVAGAPFVVPGGRFNEMYGWDSYFILLGLLQDDSVSLAKSMVDNAVYEIEHYGAFLNANRTYYLTRSQPPFLTSMLRACYERLPKSAATRAWLRSTLETAIKEYHQVWMNPNRLTKTGLSRYFDTGAGAPPEVEPGHFDLVFAPYAREKGMTVAEYERAFRAGEIANPALDAYFVHDRCMRESGHDTSYRLQGCCADLVTVDLNSLLYKVESDIAEILNEEFGGELQLTEGSVERGSMWRDRAATRVKLMNRYLWNEEAGMFFDYDVSRKAQTGFLSATTFYPLWAKLASTAQAARLVRNALPLLEMPGGIAGCTQESRGRISAERPLRQWDYPHGWAPHQMLVWQGMLNYGYPEVAHRLAYRWLFTITRNAADYNGTVPEKFDVVERSHQVFAEYGNVGTSFAYITREGFGWTNASYQVGLSILLPSQRNSLNRLIPPEWVFSQTFGTQH